MTVAINTVSVTADTYVSVAQFYAWQAQLLDDGHIDRWAATFTPDAVIANRNRPEPAQGRGQIAAVAGRIHAESVETGIARRHWYGMLDVVAAGAGAAAGELRVRAYSQIIDVASGGAGALRACNVNEDELVPADDHGWQVKRRTIRPADRTADGTAS